MQDSTAHHPHDVEKEQVTQLERAHTRTPPSDAHVATLDRKGPVVHEKAR